ncbi:MAG: flagellar basal body P-ring protein FlgI [Planctomycetaceae bacterium]
MSDRKKRTLLPQLDRLAPALSRREALASMALLLAGCTELDLRLPSPEERRKNKARKNTLEALRGKGDHSKLIGDYIGVSGLNTVTLEGVGLVTNLDNTGDDPPASALRAQLLDDMKRRDIKDPNSIIADPSTALVMVRAYLPPLIREYEKFDVEVSLPDGSEATSLRGGALMECELTERAYLNGGVRKGLRLAVAHGALIPIDEDKKGEGSRRGVIPAGATYSGRDQNLSLHLRPDYASIRMAQVIANRIGQRFHDYDSAGQKRALAEPKTDSKIELILHRRYRDNYPRYLQVISNIQLRDTPVDCRLRMERLRDELLVGPTAELAALQLEGIGAEAVPVLREGLDSEDLEVRFHAAQALAYQGHSDCAKALGEAADKEPAFRVFALAALAAVGGTDAIVELSKLLDHESMETRYGAVRALSTINEDEPLIGGERAERGWMLRVVESKGAPMIHVTERLKEEIVVFGVDQEFQPPMVVSAGRHFLIKAEPGKPLVTISRFVEGRDVVRTTVPARVAAVIAELGRLKASYPDVVQMLVEAEKQHNLAGLIAIDELPRAGRIYTRSTGEDGAVGHEGSSPNLFGIDFEAAASGKDAEEAQEDEESDKDLQAQTPSDKKQAPTDTDKDLQAKASTDKQKVPTDSDKEAADSPDTDPVGFRVQ